MTQPVVREGVPALRCLACDEPMRWKFDGVRKATEASRLLVLRQCPV